jgi:hypothetical protein
MPNIWDKEGKLIGSIKDVGRGSQNTYYENGQPSDKIAKQQSTTSMP